MGCSQLNPTHGTITHSAMDRELEYVYAPPDHHAVLVIPTDPSMGAPEYAHIRTFEQTASLVCMQGQNSRHMHVDRCPACPHESVVFDGFYPHELINLFRPSLVVRVHPSQGSELRPNAYLDGVSDVPIRGTAVIAALGNGLGIAPLPACIGTTDCRQDLLRYYGRSARSHTLNLGTVRRRGMDGSIVHVLLYDPSMPAGREADADTDEEDSEYEWCWTMAGERVKVHAAHGTCSDEE